MKYSLNEITKVILGSAINVHRALGPGLLESAYEACLVYELAFKKFENRKTKEFAN